MNIGVAAAAQSRYFSVVAIKKPLKMASRNPMATQITPTSRGFENPSPLATAINIAFGESSDVSKGRAGGAATLGGSNGFMCPLLWFDRIHDRTLSSADTFYHLFKRLHFLERAACSDFVALILSST